MKKIITSAFAIMCFLANSIFAQTITATHTYDNLHRLTKTTYSNGASIAYTYDAIGNRLTMVKQAGALPLKWLSFSAIHNCSSVSLNWQTANEVNNKDFAVEQSLNGIDFTNLAIIEPNTTNSYKYNTPISNVQFTTIYYRIKQTDIDGKFSYSATQKIYFNCSEKNMAIYPNPVKNTLYIEGLSNTKNNFVITNTLGETILAFNNSTQRDFNVSALSAGVYFIKINNVKVLKFIKE